MSGGEHALPVHRTLLLVEPDAARAENLALAWSVVAVVYVARDAREALERLERDLLPAVVFVSIGDRVSLDLVPVLRAHGGLPVVILQWSTDPSGVTQARAVGANSVVRLDLADHRRQTVVDTARYWLDLHRWPGTTERPGQARVR